MFDALGNRNMKTVPQILERMDSEIDSLEFALKASTEKTDLKLMRQGALATLKELYRFITDKKWVDHG